MSSMETVEAWLQAHAGLDASTLGVDVVARAARQRMSALQCSTTVDYVAILRESAEERQILIEQVVVPETWFFRDRPAIDALIRHVVETWGPAHPGQTFRILSVPCATGEEPYSIAMALALAGWPLERVRIDAVDISRVCLGRAARGRYRRGSFRGADLAYRDAFFAPDGADAWRLDERVTAPVNFEAGNLLAPAFTSERAPYDAVFCRNLLIYFDRPTQALAIRALAGLLAPDGWLAVGPAEPVLFFEHGFASIDIGAAFLLRRSPLRPPAAAARTLRVVRPAIVPVPRAPSPPKGPTMHPAAKPSVTPMPANRAQDSLDSIRTLANAGQLREASDRGSALLAQTAPSAELLCLLAVVADAAGEGERAETLYRKSLYLDPHHVEALSHLALRAQRRGDERSARQFRERAQRSGRKVSP